MNVSEKEPPFQGWRKEAGGNPVLLPRTSGTTYCTVHAVHGSGRRRYNCTEEPQRHVYAIIARKSNCTSTRVREWAPLLTRPGKDRSRSPNHHYAVALCIPALPVLLLLRNLLLHHRARSIFRQPSCRATSVFLLSSFSCPALTRNRR